MKTFDTKVKVEEIRKIRLEELVLDILEPHVRSGDKVKVWFAVGKVFFYSLEQRVRLERGRLVIRVYVPFVYYAELNEYKRYIAVRPNGKIRLLDSLEDVSGDAAIIPIIGHGEAFIPISEILKKLKRKG